MSELAGVGPLSHSSAQTLQACEQKYVYYKVRKEKPDPDYEKSDALSIGSAFHYVLEKVRHERLPTIRGFIEECLKDPDILLPEEHMNLVHAMVLKYLRLHAQMGLKVLQVEFELRTEAFVGYIDALLEEPDGKWWITDLKSYKSINTNTLAGLKRDPQLTLYAGHAPEIAEIFKLDMDKFAGCRWRVVTKSTPAQKKGEDDATFIKRLADNNIKAYDIPVKRSELNIPQRMDIHAKLYRRTVELFQGAEAKQNFGACMNYFSPCEYWSRCHGKNHSEMVSNLEFTVLE